MDRGVKRLCTICARGGSKGVPGKNLRLLLGRPLIVHTIEQALASNLFDVIAVSSDSSEIVNVALEAGATLGVKRPSPLASDDAGKIPAIVHCVSTAEERTRQQFDVIVDLDATSPLREVSDIAGAVRLLHETGATNVITAAPARRSPYFNLVELDPGGIVRLSKGQQGQVLRRQDAPPAFDMNASIYVWQRDAFLRSPAVFYSDTRLFVMPEERSHDIDTELDFEFVTYLLERRHGR
jgi:N-acylneuraminate cytidylyltransferase/CMP-N,N'-diacetyllegionaminic acid synthase